MSDIKQSTICPAKKALLHKCAGDFWRAKDEEIAEVKRIFHEIDTEYFLGSLLLPRK